MRALAGGRPPGGSGSRGCLSPRCAKHAAGSFVWFCTQPLAWLHWAKTLRGWSDVRFNNPVVISTNTHSLKDRTMTAAATEAKVLYTGRTHTTGGRTGASRSDDGRLDIALTRFGTSGQGTNPEQLFAAGWSACFMGAMARAAQAVGVRLPEDLAVDAEVDLVQGPGGFALAARLKVSVPGVEHAKALAIVEGAHQLCPYSRATRGNIQVDLSVA